MKKEIKRIVIYTDGSCRNNGKPNSLAGYGIHFPNGELVDISETFTLSPITNQRAELWAIYEAIKLTVIDYEKINIYSDSRYSIDCVTEWSCKWLRNDWKTSNGEDVKNKDILEPLVKLYNDNSIKIRLHHVRSHTGNTDLLSIGNDNADKLANNGLLKN